MAKFKVVILALIAVSLSSCTKKSDDSLRKSDSSGISKTQNEIPASVNDSVFFAQWDGRKIIIEDNYKFSENENSMSGKEGSDYFTYGERLKGVVKKYHKFDEQTPSYSFTEYKEEFAPYTSLRPGRKMYISTTRGTYPLEINGYDINMDDIIGSGVIFYATAPAPQGLKLEERDIMLCSYNSSMGRLNEPLTDKSTIDKFKEYVMPKLKDTRITVYDEATQKEVTKKLDKLSNGDIKVFKGSFTGTGKNEYLVGVKFNNAATSFTSGSWVMDEQGSVIKELSPLVKDNFTFSELFLTVDFNGDGILEIITNDGYYEGGAYNFNRYTGNEFKLVTSGFMFGV